jgi:putative flippase GtrA
MKILAKIAGSDKPALASQLIKFCMVGVTNNIISLSIYYSMVYIGIHYFIANAVAFAVSVLWAYWLNGKFVFKGSKRSAGSLVRVYLSYGFSLLLSSLILYVTIDLWGISPYIAPLISIAITTPINFVLNRQWVYRKKEQE